MAIMGTAQSAICQNLKTIIIGQIDTKSLARPEIFAKERIIRVS